MTPEGYVFGSLLKIAGYSPEYVSIHTSKNFQGEYKSIRLTFARPKQPRYSARVEGKAWISEVSFFRAEAALLQVLRESGCELDYPLISEVSKPSLLDRLKTAIAEQEIAKDEAVTDRQ